MPLSADPYVTRMNIQPRYESALPSTPPPSPPFPIAAPSFSTMSTSQLRTIVLLVSTVAAYLRPRSFETSPTLFFGPLFLDPRFPTLSLSLSLSVLARFYTFSCRQPQDLKCTDNANDALSRPSFVLQLVSYDGVVNALFLHGFVVSLS